MFFWGKSPRVKILTEMIGSLEEYKKTIQLSNLSDEEKDIIMLAKIQLQKKNYKSELLDKAYAILFKN